MLHFVWINWSFCLCYCCWLALSVIWSTWCVKKAKSCQSNINYIKWILVTTLRLHNFSDIVLTRKFSINLNKPNRFKVDGCQSVRDWNRHTAEVWTLTDRRHTDDDRRLKKIWFPRTWDVSNHGFRMGDLPNTKSAIATIRPNCDSTSSTTHMWIQVDAFYI